MKTKIYKFLGVALTLMLLGSLTVGLGVPVAAADGYWSTLATPQAGVLGGYVLGPTAGVTAGPGPMEKAIDETLYAYFDVGEGAAGSNLYKSTDGASTWTRCSTSTDDLGNVAITAIACSTQDAKRVYVTDGLDVYRSTDAGLTFVKLAGVPGGSAINCMAVGYNGDHFVYIGASDGEIYSLRDAFGFAWSTTYFGAVCPGRTIVALATSPKFSTEAQPQVIAVNYITATNVAYVTFSYGGAAWAAPIPGGDDIEIEEDLLPALDSFDNPIVSADIAFTADYDSSRTARDFFVGIDAGAGDEGGVYRIIAATDLRILGAIGAGINVTSVACAGNSGNCKLLAAGTTSINVWHSEDNGVSWMASVKDPACTTATTCKYLVMDKSYNSNGKAFIAVNTFAALDNASIAATADFGVSWSDLSLINTDIKQIMSMDVSSKYATDFTIFMVTDATSGADSVWKWDGKSWMRTAVFTFAPATAIIQCSPDYFFDKTVFLADTAAGQIYRSNDYGMWFKAQISLVPTLFDGALEVISSSNLLVGSGAIVYITKNNGTSWDPITVTGATAPIISFAKSPAYSTDNTLLCGDSAGRVFISKNQGLSWTQVPVTAQVASTAGALNVAFDSLYATNFYIYAAAAGTDRTYRINAATGTAWATIDSSAATPGVINASPLVPGIQMSADGTLYVASQTGTSAGGAGAADAFRILDPVGGDSGTIAVNAGSISLTVTGTATVSAATATAPTSVTWTTPAANDSIVVTATASGTTGGWTQILTTTAVSETSDTDSDATVTPFFLPIGGTYSMPDSATSAGAGSTQVMVRSLTATRTFSEAMSSSFTGTAANLKGLWYNDGTPTGAPQLWVLESSTAAASNRIWTYTDRLTKANTLLAPADKTNTGRTTTAELSWNALTTATYYQIYVGRTSTLGTYTEYFSPYATAAVSVSGLEDGVTYYWKVRSAPTNATVAGKASSPWSATWSFTTGLAAAEWDPFVDPARVVPIPGSYDVPIRPTFMWNPADWATGYEFAVSKAADFSNPVWSFKGTTALKISAFVADKDLEYSTNYYWSVTAVTATTRSVTAYGSFRTLAAPVAPTPPVTVASPTPAPVTVNLPPVEQIAPVWIWAIIAVGAVLVIAVIILIITTRRVP